MSILRSVRWSVFGLVFSLMAWLILKKLESITFLDASSHLYIRVCPSVRPSVGPSVRPSVRPSVHRSVTLSLKTGKLMILIADNDVSCNHIIIQSFHHHEDASLALWALLMSVTRGATDRRTDRPTDRRTDGRTDPVIEMRGRI